jgi:hypothetical protein
LIGIRNKAVAGDGFGPPNRLPLLAEIAVITRILP